MAKLTFLLGVLASSVAALAAAPRGEDSPAAAPPSAAAASLRATIDRTLAQSWKEHGLTPGPACDDAAFLRRLSLDLEGRVPTRAEVNAWLADRDAKKRERLVDQMLADSETARYFASVYSDILLDGKSEQRGRGLLALREALAEGFAAGKGFDVIARDLLQASGRADENPSTGFVIAYEADKDQLAAVTARAFLGVQIQCAQCHDHPFEKWSNDDFKSFAAFFQLAVARRSEKGDGKVPVYEVLDRRKARFPEMRKRMREKLEAKGEAGNAQVNERLKRALADWVEPRFLDGRKPPENQPLRESLAAWMTAPDNPWFARAAVNRIWSLLLGRGLVEPVDDLNPKNRAEVSGLLEALAADFVAHGYDLRHLYREIVLSRAYQLAAAGSKGGTADEDTDPRGLFGSYAVKPLGAEQVLRSISAAGDLRERAVAARGEGETPMADMGGPRRLVNSFRYAFMDDEGEEGEEFAGTIARALLLMNSNVIQEAITAHKGSLVSQVLREEKTTDSRLEQLFVATLSRRPDAHELARFRGYVEAHHGARTAYEDVAWALFNSSEFITNH
jgi:hypothetical protein